MTKPLKGKPASKLSPENYIRQRARTLPVYKCLVNNNWQESKMANVVIARKHVNGNVTFGLYLVDLLCLGVKDTLFAFNIPLREFEDFVLRLEGKFEELEFDKIDYALAHNIVYAGVDFATEIGFKPHPDFNKTTRFILEEDDENVELIEVECGYKGQPAVFMGDENRKECLSIIAQLDHSVGKGNYKVFDLNKLDKYEADELPDEYTPEQFEEDKKTFKKGFKNFKKLNSDELTNMIEVSERLFYHLIDDSKFDEEYNKIAEKLDITVLYNEIPDEFLGVPTNTITDADWVKTTLLDAFNNYTDDEKCKKLYTDLMRIHPDIPAVGVLDLFLSTDLENDAYIKLLEKYRAKFPNYKLFDIIKHYSVVSRDEAFDAEILGREIEISDFFGERTSLFWIEMDHFTTLYSFLTLLQADPAQIGALYDFLNEDYIPEGVSIAGKSSSLIFMIDFVNKNLSATKHGLFSKHSSFINSK